MKVFQYEFPDMLIKVSNNRKYLEDLCAGKVYMNESGYFRKLEDTYRGDKFDGKCVISFENHTGEFMELGPEESPEERIKIPLDFIQNFTVGFKGDNKIPLYCCSQLSEHILRKETEFSLKFKEEFISEMEQFGSYHAIFSKVEFLQNMLDYIDDNQLGGKWGAVSYVDIHSEYHIEILNDENRNQYNVFFKKDLSYQWQNEWRIILVSNGAPLIGENDHHFVASIKPLSWFHIGHIRELRDNSIEIKEVDDSEVDGNVLRQ